MVGSCGPPKSFYVLLGLLVVLIIAFIVTKSRAEGYELAYPSDTSRPSHPVLDYQRETSYGTHPANYGDPIRPPPSMLGPSSLGNYPFVGKPAGVPVPQNAFKETSEKWRRPFYSGYNLGIPDYTRSSVGPSPSPFGIVDFPDIQRPLYSADFFRPYDPNARVDGSYADTPFYRRGQSGALYSDGSPRFIGSVDAFAPFPEVNTPWEKIGIVSNAPVHEDIFNLYRRPIAPLQDLFEYTVQDKNGFVIPLVQRFIENNDIIPNIRGYEGKGPWKADVFVNNKYIWV